jgi:hypothetical protein
MLELVESAIRFAPSSTQQVLNWASEFSTKNIKLNQAVTNQNDLMVVATNVAVSMTNLQHELHSYRSVRSTQNKKVPSARPGTAQVNKWHYSPHRQMEKQL